MKRRERAASNAPVPAPAEPEVQDNEDDASAWAANAEPTVIDGLTMPAPGAPADNITADGPTSHALDGARLQNIVESLLFASDKPLTVNEIKRLVGERDGKKVTEVIEAVQARHAGHGMQLVNVAAGWQFRTDPANESWVSKLLAGRPVRLSRAQLETVAIVAYKQPITRPEVDDIRGVDCGPVLGTLLERGLIRILGKKEEVGRPLLYGTTLEFLRLFALKELADLPTLRQFHELGAEEQAKVEQVQADAALEAAAAAAGSADAGHPRGGIVSLSPEPEESDDEPDALLEELEKATHLAARASKESAQSDGLAAAAGAAEGESTGG